MSDLPLQRILEASRDARMIDAVRALYEDLDARIAAEHPTCWNRGDCCQFDAYDHRLYVTPLEVAYYLAMGPPASVGEPGCCPHAKAGECTARDRRFVGCRIFFCDPSAQDWQGPMTETFLKRLKALHERFDVPYCYVDWMHVNDTLQTTEWPPPTTSSPVRRTLPTRAIAGIPVASPKPVGRRAIPPRRPPADARHAQGGPDHVTRGDAPAEPQAGAYFNPAHLRHLTEPVDIDGAPGAIVHVYCEAPDYRIVAAPEEGTACIDDAARAAVMYLRHFELTGDQSSRDDAERLLRFVMYMQTADGLFYNFVRSNKLEINTDHHRSHAQSFQWWSARAVWALGMGARALKQANPDVAARCVDRLNRALPHIHALLDTYPQTKEWVGRTIPTWLMFGDGADATSELILGLVAFNHAQPDPAVQTMISQFAEGLALMRYGAMNKFPYGMHASNKDGWHKWGNAQTQALAEAGIATSALLEAEHFYPRLLVEGFLHSLIFDDLHAIQYWERIAYGVRAVAIGLLRLYELLNDERYLKMAALAASWFLGNNEAGAPLYDPATGRGYDGLQEDRSINKNAGAESTIEALYTVLEIERFDLARPWMQARNRPIDRFVRDDQLFLQRLYDIPPGGPEHRLAVVMNLSREHMYLLEGNALATWLEGGPMPEG